MDRVDDGTASREAFRELCDASPHGMCVIDAATLRVGYSSPAMDAILCVGGRQAAARDEGTFPGYAIPEDRPLVLGALRRATAGATAEVEYRIPCEDEAGSRRVRGTVFPMRGGAALGHVVRDHGPAVSGPLQDATFLRAVVEGVPTLVWRSREGGSWTWACPQWTAYTGQAETDSHGWGWLGTLHPDDRDVARAAWAEAVRSGTLDVEFRIRRAADGTHRWFHTRAEPLHGRRGGGAEWIGMSSDIQERHDFEERQATLVAELQHRTRNLMAVVRAMVEATMESSADLESFGERFRERLASLARVQGLLSRLEGLERVAFDEVLRGELAAAGALDAKPGKVTLHGPSGIPLRSSTVQTFAMAIHELVTNAVKHGALGQPRARLSVRWHLGRRDRDGLAVLCLEWREEGVAMQPPDARNGGGQGLDLLEHALPYQLDAETSLEFTPDGLRCTMSVPVSQDGGRRGAEHDSLVA